MNGMAITSERGTPGGITQGWNGKHEVESLDYNSELQFPFSIPVYDRVRTDGQIESVMNAIKLPIMSAAWDLHTDGVEDHVAAFVRSELGLPEPGEGLRGRHRRHGIVWLEHLEQALTMLWAGFMCFEQVYQVGPPDPEQDLGVEEVIHLRKLAPRLPQTITRIETGRDGGLEAVEQTSYQTNGKPVRIPVNEIVFYCRNKEGADWSGKSILRTAYRHWLIKDALIRLDAQAGERNSMGIPVIYYSADADKEEALQLSASLRAGETAGLALEEGKMRLEIQAVQGTTQDLLPKINYHDQQMAKSALAMFLDLGHDAGARSLGETHLEIFLNSLQHTAEYIAGIATEHIIRDLVELNFGPDTAYPVLTPGDLRSTDLPPESLRSLVDSGVIVSDDRLEEYIRTRYGLPAPDTQTARSRNPIPPIHVPALEPEQPVGQQSLSKQHGHSEMLQSLLAEAKAMRATAQARHNRYRTH